MSKTDNILVAAFVSPEMGAAVRALAKSDMSNVSAIVRKAVRLEIERRKDELPSPKKPSRK